MTKADQNDPLGHTSSEMRWACLDPRSLALFRVGLGLIILFDTLGRCRWIEKFYSDEGVLSRQLLSQSEFGDDWFSFHIGASDFSGFVILFFIQAFLALALLLGWQTRWMILANWVFLNSLSVRNPFINDRGDLQLSLLLFWGFFLPLGARWSLDSRAGRADLRSPTGWPAAALIGQVAQIYLFAGILKHGDFWLVRGDGLYHSLLSPLFAKDLATTLVALPIGLLKLANYLVIVAEIFVGLLLLCPWSVSLLRGTAIVLLLGLHFSILLVFDLGLFPWVGIMTLLALLPETWWLSQVAQKIECRLGGASDRSSAVSLNFLQKSLIALAILLSVLSNFFHALNSDRFVLPASLSWAIQALRLEQHWDLFSPIPPYNGHFELRRQSDGELLKSLPDQESFPSHRWRMLMIASLYPRFSLLRPGLVKALSEPNFLGEELVFSFVVRLTSPEGKQLAPTTWILWRGKIDD